jgi:hypothetical protein
MRSSTNHSTSNDDEAIARALQAEYEREFRLSRQRSFGVQQNEQVSQASSIFRQSSLPRQQPPIAVPSAPPPPTPPPPDFPPRSGSVMLNDEELARRLQEEEEAMARLRIHSLNSALVSSTSVNSFTPVTDPTVVGAEGRSARVDSKSSQPSRPHDMCEPYRLTPATSTAGSSINNDAEVAWRLDQEQRDEEMARQMMTEEQQRISAFTAHRIQGAPVPPTPARQNWTARRVASLFFPFLVIAGVAAALIYFFTGQSSNFIPDWDDFAQEDPFDATAPEDADRWPSNGNGLQLNVINSLDERWYTNFNTAIAEWDAGNPDSLILTTSTQVPDSACNPVDGAIIVCNGNYGDTRWRGLNQVLIRGPYIAASAARMNEFYLQDSGEDQRQYTMCHEVRYDEKMCLHVSFCYFSFSFAFFPAKQVGHGFGLPHSDENFYNSDRGECMDYTVNPGNNLRPGESNFIFLMELYGTVPGYVMPDDLAARIAAETNATLIETSSTSSSEAVQASESFDGKRLLKHLSELSHVNQTEQPPRSKIIPNWIKASWDNYIPDFNQHENGYENVADWRVLHSTPYGVTRHRDLGDGYSIRVHALFI